MPGSCFTLSGIYFFIGKVRATIVALFFAIIQLFLGSVGKASLNTKIRVNVFRWEIIKATWKRRWMEKKQVSTSIYYHKKDQHH